MNDKFDLLEPARQRTLTILAEYEKALGDFEKKTLPILGKTSQSVLIPTKYLENAYTALETLFMKISQHFENHL